MSVLHKPGTNYPGKLIIERTPITDNQKLPIAL